MAQTIKSDIIPLTPDKLGRIRGMTPTQAADYRNLLQSMGSTRLSPLLPETHALPYVVHPGERITGMVHGRYWQDYGGATGRGALVATNERIILLDKQPRFLLSEELKYKAVKGIIPGETALTFVVELKTKEGSIIIRSFNKRRARMFIEAIRPLIRKSRKSNRRTP